jgi:hypothetical protein
MSQFIVVLSLDSKEKKDSFVEKHLRVEKQTEQEARQWGYEEAKKNNMKLQRVVKR